MNIGYECEGVPHDRIDIDAFQAWADWCNDISGGIGDPVSLTCNIYFDQSMSLRKSLDAASLNGRGTVVQLGAKFTCIVDKPEDVPVQRFLFTMGNIIKDSFTEEFLPMADRANAVEVTYYDKDYDYERQMLTVYADDYDTSERDINKASVTLIGCTDRYQAANYATFLLNSNRYITHMASWDADVDAIACVPGDVVDVSHDVPQYGQSGRVVSATSSGVTFDREFTIDSTKRYMVGIKHLVDDTREEIEVDAVTTGDGSFFTVVLLSPWSVIPSKGALYYIGEIGQLTKSFRVLRISRSSEQRRKITAIEYVPEVYTSASTLSIVDLPAEQTISCTGVTANEIWVGGMISSVNLSWGGNAFTWYVFVYKNSSWTLLTTTTDKSYTVTGLSTGIVYTFSVSPTSNPTDPNSESVVVDVSGANLKVESSDNSVGVTDGVYVNYIQGRFIKEGFLIEDQLVGSPNALGIIWKRPNDVNTIGTTDGLSLTKDMVRYTSDDIAGISDSVVATLNP